MPLLLALLSLIASQIVPEAKASEPEAMTSEPEIGMRYRGIDALLSKFDAEAR